MQLKRIKHYFEAYKAYLQTEQAQITRVHIWESQRVFQNNWDRDAAEWAAMYDACLKNSTSRRLWKREAYDPKRMMLELMRMQPDFTRHMFLDLFNEEKALEGRASRFVHYCNMLFEEYQDKHPARRDNSHYHDDGYQMVFLYLAFRFPEHYTLYDGEAFRRFLQHLGSPDIPAAHDLERFAKVVRTIYKMMEKEPELLPAHLARLPAAEKERSGSLLVVYDFYQAVAGERAALPAYTGR